MPSKSRRSRKHTAPAGKSNASSPAPAPTNVTTAPPATREPNSPVAPIVNKGPNHEVRITSPQKPYIAGELRTIAILTAIILVILVVLSRIL